MIWSMIFGGMRGAHPPKNHIWITQRQSGDLKGVAKWRDQIRDFL